MSTIGASAASHHPDLDGIRERLALARSHAQRLGIDALVISPGPDLRYLLGYDAIALERLTALIIPSGSDPTLVVPRLERAAATASPAGPLGLAIADWDETDDPYALVASLLPGVGSVGVDNRMWAEKAIRLRAAMPGVQQRLAGEVIRELRMRKSAGEVASLQRAGEASDTVHASVPQWLRAGRTEREVGRDIADAILAAGHSTVDFVIVASGS